MLVDTTIDARNPSGSIGFRHGSTESATFDNVKVTSTAGSVLYANDFEAASTDFAAARSAAACSSVGRSRTASTA